MKNQSFDEVMNMWLRNIKDTYRQHRGFLDSITDNTERERRLVEINTIEQCRLYSKLGLYKSDGTTHTQIERNTDLHSLKFTH